MVAKRTGLARVRKAAGYTQEQLAQALEIDTSTVARWESGRLEPASHRRVRLARLLNISGERLEALLLEGLTTLPHEPTALSRHVVQSSAAVPSSTGAVFLALTVDERERVRGAAENPRRNLDADVLGLFDRQLDASMHDDGLRGPTQTLPTVRGLLGLIEQTVRDVRPTMRRRLLSLGARGAEFAGWLCRDLRDRGQADAWYNRATEWAQEAADLPMQGYLLLKKSQMAYDQRDGLQLFMLATAAKEGPWQLPSKVRAEVTQQVARGHAMLGEPLGEVERYLDLAREWLGRNHTGGGDSALSSHYNATNLMLQTASCYIEAGRPRQAAALYDDALRAPGLSRRDQGYFLARHTVALSLAGEPDEAAGQGLRAVEIATETSSKRTIRELERALHTLEPWRGRPGPRELREAVGAA